MRFVKSTLKIFEIIATADEAKKIIEIDTFKNRPKDMRDVALYTHEMKTDNWRQNSGLPLIFSYFDFPKKVTLIDGLTRLTAQAKSGKTLKWLVVVGVPEKEFIIYDQQRRRSFAQLVQREHIADPKTVASVVRHCLIYKKNKNFNVGNSNRELLLTNEEQEKFLDRNRVALMNIIGYCKKVHTYVNYLTVSQLSVLYYIFADKQSDKKVYEFFEAYATGKNVYGIRLGTTDAVYELREKLSNQKEKKLSLKEKYAYAILAFNAFLRKEKVKALLYDPNHDYPRVR